jgi:ketosteroid isomerase-like protein
MDITELIAREHIRELIASYNHFGDRGRIDEMTALFAPDAELDGFGQIFNGHDEIRGFFGGIVDGTVPRPAPDRTFMRHHISNVTIEMQGPDGASGAAYWLVISDDGLESSGRYRDTYMRDGDGNWKFATRMIRRDEPRR